jgi:uncharacterized protein (DUF2147 family)
MKIRQLGLTFGLLASLITFNASAADVDSPIGRWRTYDDKTHQPRGIVRIYEKAGKLFGSIERAPEKKDDGAVCSACTDERKNQPIDGLVIIRNMERDGDEWVGGDIIDPDDGKLYRFKMHLEDHGTKLIARGFIGISLLGRSQTWVRLP